MTPRATRALEVARPIWSQLKARRWDRRRWVGDVIGNARRILTPEPAPVTTATPWSWLGEAETVIAM